MSDAQTPAPNPVPQPLKIYRTPPRPHEPLLARYRAMTSLPAMVLAQAAALGDKPACFAKRNGGWQPTSYADYGRRIRALAAKLRALGVGRGDRVAIVSENRPEWGIADVAIMALGAVSVPAYTTNTVRDHVHILSHSGAKGVIYSTAKLGERILPALAEAPAVSFAIAFEDSAVSAAAAAGVPMPVLSYAAALAEGAALPDTLDTDVGSIGRTDLACLIYTSGTGGTPKGVMLSHGAILTNCLGAFDLLMQFGLDDEVFLSFLPLSHSYEHSAGLFFPLSIGAQIYYAESVEQVVNNMGEVRPTIMTSVPRLYETIHRRIEQGLAKQPKLKQRLFAKALAIGKQRYNDPAGLSLLDRLLDPLLDRLVRKKVAARFGGRLKAFVSGGAPLTVEVGLFFNALGIRLLQGYGQTEAAPVISCNPPQKVKIHTVGTPCPDIDLAIAADGEILIRGELVMQGYWRDPEATAAALKDGWLHTGDIGVVDADGYLQITDRKKDIIVLSGGDNVAPQRIEGFLTLQPEIGQAMVYGDKRPHLVALVVPEAEWLKGFAKAQGKAGASLKDLQGDPALKKALGAAIDKVNRDLGPIEKVKRFVIAAEPFGVDNGQATPTLKIRRHAIRAVYQPALDALYGGGD